MYRPRIASFIAISLLVAACSTLRASGQPSSGGAPSTQPGSSQGGNQSSGPGASQGGGGGEGVANVELHVGSGTWAGDYTATLLNAGCARNFIAANSFSVSSDQVEATGKFGGPELQIFDAAAAASGTDQFVFGAPFDLYKERLEIVPQQSGPGTGTATVDDRGATATLTVEGTTAHGITLSATIECHSIVSG